LTVADAARVALRSPALHAVLALFLAAAGSAWWIESIGGAARVRAPLPGDVVAIANGSLYGIALATALNWLGWYVAAFVQFSIGRRAARDFDLGEHLDRLPGFLRRFPVEHPAYLLIARLLPWAGGHVTTWIPGAAGVRVWRFAWCTAVAIVPASIGFSVVGAGAARWLGP
jgi:uncharacterized membrane protein YdjX (TVP38/TMEM64 family)